MRARRQAIPSAAKIFSEGQKAKEVKESAGNGDAARHFLPRERKTKAARGPEFAGFSTRNAPHKALWRWHAICGVSAIPARRNLVQ
jgi:hypothetical protein